MSVQMFSFIFSIVKLMKLYFFFINISRFSELASGTCAPADSDRSTGGSKSTVQIGGGIYCRKSNNLFLGGGRAKGNGPVSTKQRLCLL